MKVYFAFSIRGGTPDERIIQTVYKLLKEMRHEVTTEFNINRKSRERYMSDRDIYRRDVEALEKSDVILAEVSKPSLGVGYEIAFGEKIGKRVICLVREGVHLSAMINGNPNLTLITYRDKDDLTEKLLRLFNKV